MGKKKWGAPFARLTQVLDRSDRIVALGLFLAQIVLFKDGFVFSRGPLWNGQVYGSSVYQWVTKGFQFSKIDYHEFPAFAAGQMMSTFIQHCLLWIGSSGLLGASAGFSWAWVFALIDFFGFLGGAWFVYLICRRSMGLSVTASFFSGLWMLAFNSVKIIYWVQAHPEPFAIFFTAGTVYFYLQRQHVFGLVFALGALLSKGTSWPVVALLTLFLGLDQKVRPAVFYGGVFILHQFFLRKFLPDDSPQFFLSATTAKVIHSANHDRAVFNIFANFDVVGILALLGFSDLDRERRTKHLMFFGLGALLIVLNTDWWRNLYASLFVSIVPLAARYFDTRILRVWGVEVGLAVGVWFTLYLLRPMPTLSEQPDFAPSVLMAVFILGCLEAASVRRQRPVVPVGGL